MKILLGIVIFLIVLVVLYLLAIMPRMIGRADATPFKERLYAHRGLHDNESSAPENSMAAFRKAVEAGFGIELDVQLTKDKVPVIFHDFNLMRMCGVEGKLSSFTMEELQQLHLGKSEERIPCLDELLKMVKGQVPLIIEYKISGSDVEVCRVSENFLKEYKGAYCVESFNPLGVLWYRKNRKDIVRGQLADSFIKEKEKGYPRIVFEILHNLVLNFLTKPDFIAYNHKHYKDLSRCLCRYLYRGTAVAWTIRNQEDLNNRRKDFDIFIFDSFLPNDE